jgi:hypothetical protein
MQNNSERGPSLEDSGLLRSMRARYPGWQIERQGPVWVAVSRPMQTSLNMLYAEDLAVLGKKLDLESRPPASDG